MRERERESKRRRWLLKFFVLSAFLFLPLFISNIQAFASEGNINSTNKYSYNENIGWQNFRPSSSGITVKSSELSGYLWCENIGWVKLKGTAQDSTAYGVTNDGSGNLSGYGWSENAGWINFAPTGVTGANAAKINTTTRQFSGYVWGENCGWIKLSGTAQDATAYYVQTTWPPTVNSWTYTHSTKALVLNFNESMVDTQTTPSSFTIATSAVGANAFALSGGTVSGGTATSLTITLTDSDRDIISKWDGDGIATPGSPGGIYLSWSAGASQDQYGNNLAARSSSNGLQCATWQEDANPPVISSTTYNANNKRLTFVFNQTININTFTAANLANLSIQDGTTTVALSGATIISTQDGTTMIAKLTAAEDASLYAIRNNTLRVVVAANCGIKDLAANQLAQNTYASSTYTVTYQADTTAPVVTATAYDQATRKLTVTFDEYIDVSTFTQANLGNLSIQDGTTTVHLTGATIVTTQNSTVMEATLTVAEDNALYAIRTNTLRLVVAANCGIKDLSANELTQNTYATSTYSVTYNTATSTPISGTLKDSKSSLIIANATVQLLDAAGNIRAETTSDTSGNFSFNANVPSGDYTLSITKSPYFKNDAQNISIVAGTPVAEGDILIDPFGIVYDAVTGEVIAGATVVLYTASGNIYTGSPQPNPQSSRADGGYNFDVAPGQYYLTAAADGYANYTGTVFPVTTEIVEWNIPMNPNGQASSTYLSIIKQANKKTATAGDIVTYTVNITNLSSTLTATGVLVTDNLPHGFKYVSGSTLIDGAGAADPTGTSSVVWSLGTLSPQATKRLSYRARVGPDTSIGKAQNSATISATIGGNPASAGPSTATIEIREGLFSDRGILIGKVFEDKNGNGIQDKDEPGIPNVSLIMEDGTVITTDEFGRYSVPNIEKGMHVIRLDQRVAPGGPFSKTKPQPEAKDKAVVEPGVGSGEPNSLGEVGELNKSQDREPLIERRQLDAWRRSVLTIKPVAKTETQQTGQKAVDESTASSANSGNAITQEPSNTITQQRTPQAELRDRCIFTDVKDSRPRGQYRPDIPKESKFFKLYGSETVKVNFPVRLLSKEEAEKEAKKDSQPNQFMLVGLADATIGYLKSSGNIQNLEAGVNEPLEKNVYRDGKVKLYLKGLVKGEYLLTAGLDTSKKSTNHLFEYINPEKYYPIYGDKSTFFDETDSKSKFYLRIDKDSSYGLWGNYNTQEFTKQEFTRYNRTLQGAKAHIALEDFFKNREQKAEDRGQKTEDGQQTTEAEKQNVITPESQSVEASTPQNSEDKGQKAVDSGQRLKIFDGVRTEAVLSGVEGKSEDRGQTSEEARGVIESLVAATKPTIDFFYAKSPQEQASDTFSAKGISGPFWISHTPLLEYTEFVRLETRDKNRSDVVLYTKRMSRDIDYEIDYDSGRILFKAPIATRDENDDPNFVVVDYEYVPSSESKNHTSGIRLETKLFSDKLTVGGQIVSEEHPSNSPRIYGLDAVWQPDAATRVAAEFGRSQGILENNVSVKEDSAWKVEGSKTLGKLKLQGYFSKIGNNFRNPVNVTEKGVEKYGATADYALTDATHLIFDHWRNYSTLYKTFDRESSLNIYHQKEKYFLAAGYSLREYKDKNHSTPDRDINDVSLRSGYKLFENLIASLEQEFKFEKQSKVSPVDNQTSITTGRLDYKLTQDLTVYIKDQFTKELHKKYENISSLGFSHATPDGDAYVEYGFGGQGIQTTFGLKQEQNLSERLTLSSYMNNVVAADKNEENTGFGAKYKFFEGFFANFNFENTKSKTSDTSEYSSNSQSVAFDWLPPETNNSYGLKFERRVADLSRQYNMLSYIKQELNQEFTLLFDSEYLEERSGNDTLHESKKGVLGLSFRPVKCDKLNLLSKYEYKAELNHSTSSLGTDYQAHIASLEANYELNSKIELFGKYALKYDEEKDNDLETDALTDMVVAKVLYKLNSVFDLTGYYRIINDRDSRLIKQGAAFETGITVFKHVRLGIGYNFLDYEDKNASDEGYSGSGPYFNVSMKI